MADQDGVTIDLKNKPPHDYSTGGRIIHITSDNEPTRYFCRYTHQDDSGGHQPFQLSKIWDDQQNDVLNGHGLHQESQDKKATSVAAYYWKHENGTQTPTRAILVGVTIAGSGGTKYYARSEKGNKDWHEHDQLSTNGDKLEKVLDDLVCQHYNAVTIDLTKSHSEKHARGNGDNGRNSYCCNTHKSRITVTSEKIYCQTHSGKSILTYYKHEINSGGNYRFAGIKYYSSGDTNSEKDRKRIKLTGYGFPLPNVKAVYAFYCSENRNGPALIYVDGGGIATSWYHKPDSSSHNNGDEQWTPVTSLNGITPKDFSTLNHQQWSDLKKGLKEHGANLEDCKDTVKQKEEELGQQRSENEVKRQGQESQNEDEKAERKAGPDVLTGDTGLQGPSGSVGNDNDGVDGGASHTDAAATTSTNDNSSTTASITLLQNS